MQKNLTEPLPSAVLMLDHHCTDIVEEGNIVQVSFTDKRSIQANIVIGADGIHSITRNTFTKSIQKNTREFVFKELPPTHY